MSVIYIGAPLAESDLADADDIQKQIAKWIIQKSIDSSSDTANNAVSVSDALVADSKSGISNGPSGGTSNAKDGDADLYDF